MISSGRDSGDLGVLDPLSTTRIAADMGDPVLCDLMDVILPANKEMQ
jgi:hypothetical protein